MKLLLCLHCVSLIFLVIECSPIPVQNSNRVERFINLSEIFKKNGFHLFLRKISEKGFNNGGNPSIKIDMKDATEMDDTSPATETSTNNVSPATQATATNKENKSPETRKIVLPDPQEQKMQIAVDPQRFPINPVYTSQQMYNPYLPYLPYQQPYYYPSYYPGPIPPYFNPLAFKLPDVPQGFPEYPVQQKPSDPQSDSVVIEAPGNNDKLKNPTAVRKLMQENLKNSVEDSNTENNDSNTNFQNINVETKEPATTDQSIDEYTESSTINDKYPETTNTNLENIIANENPENEKYFTDQKFQGAPPNEESLNEHVNVEQAQPEPQYNQNSQIIQQAHHIEEPERYEQQVPTFYQGPQTINEPQTHNQYSPQVVAQETQPFNRQPLGHTIIHDSQNNAQQFQGNYQGMLPWHPARNQYYPMYLNSVPYLNRLISPQPVINSNYQQPKDTPVASNYFGRWIVS